MISFLSSIRHPPSPNTTSTSPVTHPHHLSVATTHTTHLRRRSPTTVLLLHPEPQSPSDTSSAAHSHHHRQVAALNHHPSTSPSSDKIFQFNGANSNIQEMAKALEVIQFLKDKYHEGTCNVGDDGKLQAEGDSSEFWVIFGGFAPIGKRVLSDDDVIPKRTPGKLYSIFQFSSQDKSTNHSPSQSRWFNSCCNPSTYKFTRPKCDCHNFHQSWIVFRLPVFLCLLQVLHYSFLRRRPKFFHLPLILQTCHQALAQHQRHLKRAKTTCMSQTHVSPNRWRLMHQHRLQLLPKAHRLVQASDQCLHQQHQLQTSCIVHRQLCCYLIIQSATRGGEQNFNNIFFAHVRFREVRMYLTLCELRKIKRLKV
ncbi:uncharacterized protein LOC110873555 isoform X2 [Helianthus annuus]|uniref:uncharacterized protein LOC110873555 isoform X2 n=1 Tax=Helianthus annuus TaxID=4232 RepID=UPI00165304E3|nr:uncharacterized protein LOC110873555 isoform X2 [Helianthus annuus]